MNRERESLGLANEVYERAEHRGWIGVDGFAVQLHFWFGAAWANEDAAAAREFEQQHVAIGAKHRAYDDMTVNQLWWGRSQSLRRRTL